MVSWHVGGTDAVTDRATLSGMGAAEEEAAAAEAASRLRQLSFQVCFISFREFKAHGRLVSHEVARRHGQLVMLDTFEELVQFVSDHPTLFISHQWLGFTEPDPFGLHFHAICRAVADLCAQQSVDEDELYIWLDYVSIPQANKTLQALSISSLAVCSSICRYFVIVCPPTVHADSGLVCNADTYRKRGWCRLEQMARMAVGGLQDIYIYRELTEQAVEQCTGQRSTERGTERCTEGTWRPSGTTEMQVMPSEEGGSCDASSAQACISLVDASRCPPVQSGDAPPPAAAPAPLPASAAWR